MESHLMSDSQPTKIRIHVLQRTTNQPSTGLFAQMANVDKEFVFSVLPGQKARQHSGIWCHRIRIHNHQSSSDQRLHSKASNQCHIRVSSSNEDQSLGGILRGVIHQ